MHTQHEKGSMLVLASFILITISLLSTSFWNLLRINTKVLSLKEGQVRAHFAAKGGIEDAVYELKEGHEWGDLTAMSAQWSRHDATTLFKTTTGANALTHFDYPATISVSVLGIPTTEPVTINAIAQITAGNRQFDATLEARVIRTLSGEFHVISVRDQ